VANLILCVFALKNYLTFAKDSMMSPVLTAPFLTLTEREPIRRPKFEKYDGKPSTVRAPAPSRSSYVV